MAQHQPLEMGQGPQAPVFSSVPSFSLSSPPLEPTTVLIPHAGHNKAKLATGWDAQQIKMVVQLEGEGWPTLKEAGNLQDPDLKVCPGRG